MMGHDGRMSTEQTIILTPQSVADALDEVQRRCTSRLLTLSDVEAACREAEARMDHWGVPATRRVGATMTLLPWYARRDLRRRGTRVEMRRAAGGWCLVAAERPYERYGLLPAHRGVIVTIDASAADLAAWAGGGALAIRLAR